MSVAYCMFEPQSYLPPTKKETEGGALLLRNFDGPAP